MLVSYITEGDSKIKMIKISLTLDKQYIIDPGQGLHSLRIAIYIKGNIKLNKKMYARPPLNEKWTGPILAMSRENLFMPSAQSDQRLCCSLPR